MPSPLMTRESGRRLLSAVWIALAAVLCAGCAKEKAVNSHPTGDACLDCHTDQAQLVATAAPDTATAPPDTGEG